MRGAVIKHGHAQVGQRSPEHRAWTGMKQRCTNPRNPKFHAYGGRGITVCERWLRSFDDFLSDLGPRPSNAHSLERKQVNGNYEPDNCEWATRTAQQRNRRVNKTVHFDGREMKLFDALKLAGNLVAYSTAYSRLIQGWSVERSLTQPKTNAGRPRIPFPIRKRTEA